MKRLLPIVIACSCFSCGGSSIYDASVSPEGPTGTTAQCVINGDVVKYDDIGSPMVGIEALLKMCSSTQLSDTWLLTAHHCLTNEDALTGGTQTDPSLITIYTQSSWAASETVAATAVATYLHPTLDIGLIRLAAPLLGANGEHHYNTMMPSNVASLVGQVAYQQGWGANAVFITDDAGDLGYSGIKTLRGAYFTVGSYVDGLVNVFVNSCGQLPWSGDSGSALFGFVNGERYIIGVTSTVWVKNDQPNETSFVASDTFADWAMTVMAGTD